MEFNKDKRGFSFPLRSNFVRFFLISADSKLFSVLKLLKIPLINGLSKSKGNLFLFS